jgi:hypothetical protein
MSKRTGVLERTVLPTGTKFSDFMREFHKSKSRRARVSAVAFAVGMELDLERRR